MSKNLYIYYSIPLRDFLFNKGIRYELGGKHMTTNNPFWVYIKNEKLNNALSQWSLR